MTQPSPSEFPQTPPTRAEAKAETSSLGDLLAQVSSDISVLMRQEVELAKAELKESTSRAGKGVGLLAGAGVAGHFVLLFLSVALWWGLGLLLGGGWSAVIVAVIWAIIAAILYASGKKEMKTVRGMPRTVETVKEIPETLKPSEETR
ncbi:phage holin family protein [Arthrobacter sp. I2-34]|uniref:Phage holin family protein n=1 Tax=Arthrobacter hankyongi TaxID=2904801 RepID=A0ABS9LA26_9MICC|nr:phage holin family protein [Arthrobacter hankyongi]MCG2623358.1 phage holin family protein [Arthrobacter hankyongi]